MKTFKQLYENPDKVKLEDKEIKWDSKDAVVFAYDNDDQLLYTPLGVHSSFNRGGNKTHCEGRLWKYHKVITFWDYPDKKMFDKIIKDLDEERIHIDDTWRVEICDADGDHVKFIKPSEYLDEYKLTRQDIERAIHI